MENQKGFDLAQQIRLQDKVVALADLREKELPDTLVRSVKESRNKLYWTKLAYVKDAGRIPMMELVTTRGHKLTAAPTTRLFTARGIKELQEFKPQEDFVYCVLNGEVVRSKVLELNPVAPSTGARIGMAEPGIIISVNEILVIPD